MSVVNEINAHFNGLHRDLKELAKQLDNLSVELQAKQLDSLPDLSPQASGLLPGIASRQCDLNKLITHLTTQVNLLRGVVSPPQTSARPVSGALGTKAADQARIGIDKFDLDAAVDRALGGSL